MILVSNPPAKKFVKTFFRATKPWRFPTIKAKAAFVMEGCTVEDKDICPVESYPAKIAQLPFRKGI
jgi:hypothetical protein